MKSKMLTKNQILKPETTLKSNNVKKNHLTYTKKSKNCLPTMFPQFIYFYNFHQKRIFFFISIIQKKYLYVLQIK